MANKYANKVLKQGSKGEAVGYLQQQLVDNFNAKIQVDNDFGGKTKSAVKDFQKSQGLKDDGIVGKNTWAKIDSESKTSNPPPAPDAPAPDQCMLNVRVVCRNSRRGMMPVQKAEVKIGKEKKKTDTNGRVSLTVKAGMYKPQVIKRKFVLEENAAKLKIRAVPGGTLDLHLEMTPQ